MLLLHLINCACKNMNLVKIEITIVGIFLNGKKYKTGVKMYSFVDCLEPESAKYRLWTSFLVFIRFGPCLFLYVLSMTAVALKWRLVLTEMDGSQA